MLLVNVMFFTFNSLQPHLLCCYVIIFWLLVTSLCWRGWEVFMGFITCRLITWLFIIRISSKSDVNYFFLFNVISIKDRMCIPFSIQKHSESSCIALKMHPEAIIEEVSALVKSVLMYTMIISSIITSYQYISRSK